VPPTALLAPGGGKLEWRGNDLDGNFRAVGSRGGSGLDVKGTAVGTLPVFVEERFGREGLELWLNTLNEYARKAFSKPILQASWFPIQSMFVEPTGALCDLFYNGKIRGAYEIGRFSAEVGLRGVYKVFLKIGSTRTIIEKATLILPTYYRPSSIEVVEMQDRRAVISITEFPEPNELVEERIRGWMERALEISGARSPIIKIEQSMARGAPTSDFVITWN